VDQDSLPAAVAPNQSGPFNQNLITEPQRHRGTEKTTQQIR